VSGWVWLGAFLASAWLELLGTAVGVLAGPHAPGITTAAHQVIGAAAVAAIVLGALAANAANVYSNSLSAAALGIRAPRWVLAIAASAIGLGASLASSGRFEQAYQNFLLLLGYWFTAWLGVQVADFYLLRRRPPAAPATRRIGIPAIAAFCIAIGAEIPFMSSTLWTGWVARSIGGADLAFYVGFTAAALTYLILSSGALQPARSGATGSRPARPH
jgi:NCS1 family nucleobase:cation symporter-1